MNQWFKFYGSEYLSDPKMLAISSSRRSCWITLLSYASLDKGVVRHVDEHTLMMQANVPPMSDEWEKTVGVLKLFEKLGMIQISNGEITILNWGKRQEVLLTNAERQARYREKHRDNEEVTPPRNKSNARIEEKRIEKKREEKPQASVKFLEKLPDDVLQELSQKYKISKRGIQSKATDLLLYCKSRDKRYKNYQAFLENALRKDVVALRNMYPLPTPSTVPKVDLGPPPTPEQKAHIDSIRKELNDKFKIKT